MEASISYSVDLIIRLIDTTTGYAVTERQVIFTEDGNPVAFLGKENGVYVGMNMGKTDRELRVKVKGYLETDFSVVYADIAGRYPEVLVYLIPEIPTYGFTNILEIKGNLLGIESVDAVSVTDPYGKAQAYQPQKQQMKLLDSKKLTERAYALLHTEPESFEEFHIYPAKNKQILKLKDPLLTECKPEEIITRIIRGKTWESGDYTLRVRGDGRGTEYLVRYVVNGQTEFKRIVFDDN